MGSADTRTTSMRMARSMGERLATLLFALKQQGSLADWVDPIALAQRMGSHYLASVISWATSKQTPETLRAASEYEQCLVLLGAATHKRDRELLQTRLLAAQPIVTRAALEQAPRETNKTRAR